MFRRITTTFALASAFFLAVAGTAHADDTTVFMNNGLGHANWVENGDRVEVCDDNPDGYGIRAYVYRPNSGDPGNGTVLIKASDPKYDFSCASAAQDISETITIYIKICKYAGSWVGDCNWKEIPR